MGTTIWGYIAILAVIGIWSFVFKDNKIYRCVQGTYIGMLAGNALANAMVFVWDMNIIPLAQGKWLMVIPLVLGLLLYVRVFGSRKYVWLSRISMGFIVGVGTAVATFGAINGQLLQQMEASVLSLVSFNEAGGLDLLATANGIIIVVGILSIFSYFLFSKASKNTLVKHTSKAGRYFMMVTFGVAFGNIITGRITTFTQAIQTVLVNLF